MSTKTLYSVFSGKNANAAYKWTARMKRTFYATNFARCSSRHSYFLAKAENKCYQVVINGIVLLCFFSCVFGIPLSLRGSILSWML